MKHKTGSARYFPELQKLIEAGEECTRVRLGVQGTATLSPGNLAQLVTLYNIQLYGCSS